MKYTHITIAGKICTGKSTVRHYLENALGWHGLSTGELFRAYAREHNLQLEKAEEQDKIGREVDTMIQQKLRNEQHLVIDTWINGVLSAGLPDVGKVLLICNDKVRIQRFMTREKVPFNEAKKRIAARENALLTKLSAMYDIDDILDPRHYNIVVDTSRIFAEEAGNIIINKLYETGKKISS